LKAYDSIQAWFPFIFGCSKNPYIHYKTMFTCWVSLFCNGFTLGPMAQATLVHIMYPCWESPLWWSLHVLFYLLLFFQTIPPQKRIWKKIKTFEAKKKQPWVSMDLSTNAYWETIPPWHYKIEEKQFHFTSYVENSHKAIDYYIECQNVLLIPCKQIEL
jgi:hypothetical protein